VLEPAKLRAFVQEVSQRTMVIVDEAYMELLDAPYNESLIPLTKDNKNLIILKTFSKIYAMAGMRVGYVIAHPDTTNSLLAANFGQSSFCVSVLGLAAAIASLKNTDHALGTKKQIIEAREWTSQQLRSMGYRVIPSYTNFIYYAVPNFKGDFAKHMYEQKILMRSDSTIDGNWARVSVGRMDEMKSFVEVMKKV
jgi:histidinol-phosphate aminotransferase